MFFQAKDIWELNNPEISTLAPFLSLFSIIVVNNDIFEKNPNLDCLTQIWVRHNAIKEEIKSVLDMNPTGYCELLDAWFFNTKMGAQFLEEKLLIKENFSEINRQILEKSLI